MAVATATVVVGIAAIAQASVYHGYKTISRSSTSYQSLVHVCHIDAYPMTFWNDGSTYATRVKNTNLTTQYTYTKSLVSGEMWG